MVKNKLAFKHQYKESFQYWYDFLINDGNGEDYDKEDIEAFYFEDYLMTGMTWETNKCSITI